LNIRSQKKRFVKNSPHKITFLYLYALYPMTELQKQAMVILWEEMLRIWGTERSYDMADLIKQIDPNYKEVRQNAFVYETIQCFVWAVSVTTIICFVSYMLYLWSL